MIEVKTLEISGFRSVLEALRLPFGKECRSETSFSFDQIGNQVKSHSNVNINEKDLTLLSTLVKRGDEHAKAIRGLVVYAEINAPLMFWSEADTYRVGTDRISSESTMHTLGKRMLTIDDFDCDEVVKSILKATPSTREYKITPLYFEEPEELKSVIKVYCGREYEIWNNGDIYSLPYDIDEDLGNGIKRHRHFDRRKITTGRTMNQQGYYQVRLGGRKGGTTLQIHRIMAESFIDNPNNYNVVNHIDGNKGNCSPSNLEWCTSSENNKHAFSTGLKEITLYSKYQTFKRLYKWKDEDIALWRKMKEEGCTYEEISEQTGASIGMIYSSLKGRKNSTSDLNHWFKIAYWYEKTIGQINHLASLYEETGEYEFVLQIKNILPSSFMQKRVQYFSYQTLRRIYFQRRNHRLPHWHIFCDWIKTLPFADELILCERDKG